MKIASIAVMAAMVAGASATDSIQRTLRIETSFTDHSLSDAMEADLREDELGANVDFQGSWDNHYAMQPCRNDSNSASGSGECSHIVGDLPEAVDEILQKAESVMTVALPFNIGHAKSLLLPVGLTVAALLVVAAVAVVIGVRRQQLSEPMFGPVELVSDLPDPMTSAASSDESGSPDDDDEADTGVKILADRYEEEKEEEEEGDFIVA
ncbi:hypothetical protein PHPALM_29707 [Phytophthora palmivora]|uniref:RxLR effector n=1 Tax=Phytophthora palmivora TaxID=4796 RepID=A0A2P4X6V6_9STRA|nr:hypothetical protein PHPALM_29707 [Phytophthora palmivora]